MAHEIACVSSGVRSNVKRLVHAYARGSAAGDITHGVAARLASAQSDITNEPHDVRAVVELDVMELEVLAGGYMAFLQRSILLGHHA